MDLITAISALGTLLIAIIGICLALLQIRASGRDARNSRLAEISWQIYQSYVDPRLRAARGAAELVAHTDPVPTTGEEYGKKYSDKNLWMQDDDNTDNLMRRLLRFYNQVGILVEKELVDTDFVFGLIGGGMKTSWIGVRAAIDWYQNHYGGLSGFERAEPRPIHAYALKLYEHYNKWEKTTGKDVLDSVTEKSSH